MLLETRGLIKDFHGFKAIDGLDFSIEEGELRCLIGPNGAGKTTLLDLITGKTKPTAGNIYFKGEVISKLMPYEISRKGIGRKFQITNVYENLSIYENIRIPLRSKNPWVFSSLFRSDKEELHSKILDTLKIVGLENRIWDKASTLSHGEKQCLELGMLLAEDPLLMLLDEPTAGMTEEETNKTADLIKSISKDHSLIVIEHDIRFIKLISKKISVLHQGKLLAEGSIKEIEKNREVREVYLGGNYVA